MGILHLKHLTFSKSTKSPFFYIKHTLIFPATCNSQKTLDKHWSTGTVKIVSSHYGQWKMKARRKPAGFSSIKSENKKPVNSLGKHEYLSWSSQFKMSWEILCGRVKKKRLLSSLFAVIHLAVLLYNLTLSSDTKDVFL